jgi:hypothetical protein
MYRKVKGNGTKSGKGTTAETKERFKLTKRENEKGMNGEMSGGMKEGIKKEMKEKLMME